MGTASSMMPTIVRTFARVVMAFSSARLRGGVHPDADGLVVAVDGHQLAFAAPCQDLNRGADVQLVTPAGEQGAHHLDRDLHLHVLVAASVAVALPGDDVQVLATLGDT